ncbi:unnamed protein product [Paramecium pentaurelia]|uniref:Uncharacterized protein n=1 Tax=Paramecium pentaurelia TaxID=43138 RepID=A0A8S1VVA4_9CILI|nr:unnamed protein product [Paramecium pentaurelia]
MEQQQKAQAEPNIEQDINTVFDNLERIRTNINCEIPQIPKESIVLIFLGEFEQKFQVFFQHFQIKQTIKDEKYFKIIRIEKQGKISFLLNFPLILQYDDQNNEQALNLCISKIYAEQAFQKMENCKIQLIVDVNQLNGDDDKAKFNSIINDQVFYFGKYYFKENTFLFLRPQNEDKWNLQTIKKFHLNKQKNEKEYQVNSDFKELKDNEVLKSIFQATSNYSQLKVNSDNCLNYGKMNDYLKDFQEILTPQFDNLLKQFQKQLLIIQQMPIIQSQDDTIKKVGNYFKALQVDIINEENPLTNSFADISKVFTFINKVNKEKIAIELNQRIQQKINSKQMQQFLEDNKIEKISIQPFFNDNVQNKLNKIIDFYKIYQILLLQTTPIVEVQNLIINLQFWCLYCEEAIENILYELNQIVKKIQEGPQNEIENGVYFIGKSTIINTILNPDKLEMTKILGQKCYEIKQGFQTKFKIGQGQVSKTQQISGIYIGKKEELDNIFYNQENNQQINNQKEQDVFSYEEILNKEQINQLKIPEKWFIFDCPGFDDNSNEQMRIAHRISLFNYFKKTKNIVVFFIIDISVQQVENIKNTFDPIGCLLNNKNDLQQNFQSWTNLILTKVKKDQRKEYIKGWKLAYNEQLEQNYSFYKQLFADDQRCIEFLRPQMNMDFNELRNSIIEKAKSQLQQEKKYNPSFEFTLDEKVWRLYDKCMPKIQMKLEQLLQLFFQDLESYIVQSDETIKEKKEQLQKFLDCLHNQQTNIIISEINVNNCISLLSKLSQWIKGNKYTQKICFFLEAYIQDIQAILKISEYCNNKNIVPFKIKIDIQVTKIKNILKIIEEIEKQYQNCQSKFYCVIIMIFIPLVGFGSIKCTKSIAQHVRDKNQPIAKVIKYLLKQQFAQIITVAAIKQYFIYKLPKLAQNLFPEEEQNLQLKEKSKQFLQNEQQDQ